jgi:hypothetical protein
VPTEAPSPTIESDKAVYRPGEQVTLTGANWQPGEAIQVFVDDEADNEWSHTADVVAADDGTFSYRFRLPSEFAARYTVTATGALSGVATTAFADPPGGNPSADLDQCANGSLSSPNDPACSPDEWVNGNLGSSKAHYFEGDSVPYRLVMGNLSLPGPHTVTIEWDTTKGGKHAIDYLTSFDRTVTTADPCAGVAGCSGPANTFPIPLDGQVDDGADEPIDQIGGVFSLYGGTITSVGVDPFYLYPDGTDFAGDKTARISIAFDADVANPVLAWGGHISSRDDWGPDAAAVAIPGSPYHMRLIDLDGSGGNQDRSLSADAVIFPASITIIKDAIPDSAQAFGFTATGGLSPAGFTLDDDGADPPSNTQVYSGILVTANNGNNYTITEQTVSGWDLTSLDCEVETDLGGSQIEAPPSASINLREGENVSCTFVNTAQAAHLTLVKEVIRDNGGTAEASDWTLSADGPTPISGPGGADSNVNAGTYLLSESGGPAGYTPGAWVCVGGSQNGDQVTLGPGGSATCTITNNDQPGTLIVKKVLILDDGGTLDEIDFEFSVNGGTPQAFEADGQNDLTVDAGTYSVVEPAVAGYTTSYNNCTDVVVANGGSATCTITNNDQPPEPQPGLCPAGTICAVDDIGTLDSKLYNIDPDIPTVEACGNFHDGANFEGLESIGLVLYAASGETSDDFEGLDGGFYIVDADACSITFLGLTGFDDVEALAVNPLDKSMWGFAEDDGLIEIDYAPDNPPSSDPLGTLVSASTRKIEGMTWSIDGQTLYGVGDDNLYRFSCSTGGSLIGGNCTGGVWIKLYDVLGVDELEGLETARDDEYLGRDVLIMGNHGDDELIYWDVDAKAVLRTIPTPGQDDWEGIVVCKEL